MTVLERGKSEGVPSDPKKTKLYEIVPWEHWRMRVQEMSVGPSPRCRSDPLQVVSIVA